MTKKIIKAMRFGEERALYNLTNAEIISCRFSGTEDGESALKEAADITVSDCLFELRYPLWHTKNFEITDSRMTDTCRAALWYAENGVIKNSNLGGIKCLRECTGVTLENCVTDSPEFGWKCSDITIKGGTLRAEYLFFDSNKITISGLSMQGKYSFQYVENLKIENSVFDTKDAFWHTKNAVIENSTLNGEYLGWYSEGLTFINCRISGTQPFCYCKNLKLINCTMQNTDLAFEYSEVEADIKGNILSVKNPAVGYINADSIGEIILEDSIVENKCTITTQK